LFFTIPFDRGHFGFGDFDIDGADVLIAVFGAKAPVQCSVTAAGQQAQ
jgi:hypothetical protein